MSAPPAGPYDRENGGVTRRDLQDAGGGSLWLGLMALAAAAVLGGVVGWVAHP